MFGKILAVGVFVFVVLAVVGYASWNKKSDGPPTGAKSVLEFSANTIEGKERHLSDYSGKVLLVVNTASECGYTVQIPDRRIPLRRRSEVEFQQVPCYKRSQFARPKP